MPCPCDQLLVQRHAGGSGSRAQATAIVVLSVMVGLTLAALLAVTLAAYGGGAAIMNTVSKVRTCLTIRLDNLQLQSTRSMSGLAAVLRTQDSTKLPSCKVDT